VALQPLSRQHHFGLLFSWKLRKGFERNISIKRLQAFRDWFFVTEIRPHFEAEERFLFPLLESEHPLVQRALADHRTLETLFTTTTDVERTLRVLELQLKEHIRFEERVLFNKIQEVATPEELEKIEQVHANEPTSAYYVDPFWE
tara:strand:- start:395 stop:829 length:435 start_codon:yes stop_codon:yes gene_type:complete